MMDINEELENILANLGVEVEQPGSQADGSSLPEATIFQASREHYGTMYRLDIIDQEPQLRIIVPIDTGLLKIEQYLVCLSARMPVRSWFVGLASYQGSSAFDREREATTYHLLQAVGELMKLLFWTGDLDSMCFPSEIIVQRLDLRGATVIPLC